MPIEGQPLEGKTALITGGTRGIGAAIARKLASWGCRLALNYVERDRPALQLRDELAAKGVEVELIKADIGDIEQSRALFETFRKKYDALDILVLNAASAIFRPLTEIDTAHLDYVYQVNIRSSVLLSQLARPLMAGRGGRIIMLSNNGATRYIDRAGAFAAAKAAMESLTRSLAIELAPDGIVVNCVRPDVVATDVLQVRPDFVASIEREKKRSPWGRITTVEDCGNAVALLCLDEASWICGQTIVLDGGTLHKV